MFESEEKFIVVNERITELQTEIKALKEILIETGLIRTESSIFADHDKDLRRLETFTNVRDLQTFIRRFLDYFKLELHTDLEKTYLRKKSVRRTTKCPKPKTKKRT